MAAGHLPVKAAGQSIFHVVPTPNENFNNGLQAVSAFSPRDIWAVGQSTIHFDGAKWTAFPAPTINGDNPSFLGGPTSRRRATGALRRSARAPARRRTSRA